MPGAITSLKFSHFEKYSNFELIKLEKNRKNKKILPFLLGELGYASAANRRF
jgi:hypothetical protein